MSFSAQVSINDGTTTYAYDQISLVDSKSVRRVASRGVNFPKSLTISHAESGSATSKTNRSLVRLNDTREDALSGKGVSTGSVYVVIEKPQRVITDEIIQNMVKEIIAFLTPANVTKLLNGEP